MYNASPFLQMLAAVGDDELQQPGRSGGGGGGVQPPQQPRQGKVQLGDFWLQAPNAWFAAMGFNVLRAVMDLVENPLVVNPYTTLNGHLVLAHQLTPIQKVTKCLQVVAGNNQWPSDVLASLLEFCWERRALPSLGPPSR